VNVMKKLLEVKNLSTSFYTHLGEVQAVRNISFSLNEGDVLGIVGESGSGKSVTALSIMRLVGIPGKIKAGQIIYQGNDLSMNSKKEMENLRGNEIAMIFQDPMTSLNPVFRIKNQMVEVIRKHSKLNYSEALIRAKDLLKQVGIPDPEAQIHDYPHQFSGGMRQRALIATAISCKPKLLIADEPTTALDVTIQAQILELLRELQSETGMSILLITHDLGVIAEICTHVIVMYGGKIMEKGTVQDIYYNPQHPYTKGLHKSIPKTTNEKTRLFPIEGSPPDLLKPPKGCPFSPRCTHEMEVCLVETSPEFIITETHSSACWLHDKEAPSLASFLKGEEVMLDE